MNKKIAIIGMSGHLPGAEDIHAFWDNVKNGRETISYFRDDELLKYGYDRTTLEHPDFIKAKGILENVEYFDSAFFGYSPQEASVMDPQMRLFHEHAWKALEDSGYVPESYKGSIGVFAGSAHNVRWLLHVLSLEDNDIGASEKICLNDKDFLSTRLAHNLNLMGPAYTIQTSCSSSLVSVNVACKSLINNECDMALSGGATVMLPVKSGYLYEQGYFNSNDGHTNTFSSKGTGTILSDGVGVVVLKRLEDAINDRDHIYAVILGSATNNDGNQRMSFMAPGVPGQQQVIQKALSDAGVNSETISYVEAHGTATHLGDVIEIEALTKAFQSRKKQYCAIGSFKPNTGHVDACSGVVALIKTALSLKNKQIPPTINSLPENPELNFHDSPFFVNRSLTEWNPIMDENNQPVRRAGVSNFGIGGTNAHAILQEAPVQENFNKNRTTKSCQMFSITAKSPSALERNCNNIAKFIHENPDLNLADIIYTLNTGRGNFAYKKSIVGNNSIDIINALKSKDDIKQDVLWQTQYKVDKENRNVVFLFPGQGSEYTGMGKSLYQNFIFFKNILDQCFSIIDGFTDLNSKQIYFSNNTEDEKFSTIAQALIVSFEYALGKTLMSFGIQPNVVIGYSLGEYAAACLSGIMTIEDTLKILISREILTTSISQGAMLSVPLTQDELIPYLDSDVHIAINNGPSTIVAGKIEAVKTFERKMRKMRILCMELSVPMAAHTIEMEAILPEFEKILSEISYNAPKIPIVSCSTGTWVGKNEKIDKNFWSRHLVNSIDFAASVQTILSKKNCIFLEIGAGHELTLLLRNFVETGTNHKLLNLIPENNQVEKSFFWFCTRIILLDSYGLKLDWSFYYADEIRYKVPLPGYSFDKILYPLKISTVGRSQSSGESANTYDVSNTTPASNDKTFYQSTLRHELSSTYKAPQNQLEKELVDMWEKLFGCKPIGVDDSFVELGGHSLKAINLINQIKTKYKKSIHPSLISKLRTIKNLVEHIKKTPDFDVNDYIIKLSSEIMNPELTMLFIPFAGGTALTYLPLAKEIKELSPNIEIFAIDFPNDQTVKSSIVNMAKFIVSFLEENIDSPLIIYGQSAGSALAIELSMLLNKSSIQVLSVFLGASLFSFIDGKKEKQDIDWFNASYQEMTEYFKKWGMETSFSEEQLKYLIKKFKEDVLRLENYCQYRKKEKFGSKLNIPCFNILSDIDTLTEGYEDKYKNWNNIFEKVELLIMKNAKHNFISTEPKKLAQLVINVIDKEVQTSK